MPPPTHPPDGGDEPATADHEPVVAPSVDPAELTPAQLASAVAAAVDDDEARTRRRAAALARDLDRLIEDARLTPPDDEHDPDGATVGFERAQLTHLLRDAERHLAGLAATRARLAAGTAGTCVACGGPIAAARRLARPVSDRCVACAR